MKEINKMKKLIILILPLLLFLSCHNQTSNKQVSLKFFPWPDVGKETLSIQSMNIYQNQKFIEAIEKGRKKLFFDKIPKSVPIEGYYGISIKENDELIEDYIVKYDDFIFDKNRDQYIKVPGILDMLRAEFFLKLLKTSADGKGKDTEKTITIQ